MFICSNVHKSKKEPGNKEATVCLLDTLFLTDVHHILLGDVVLVLGLNIGRAG